MSFQLTQKETWPDSHSLNAILQESLQYSRCLHIDGIFISMEPPIESQNKDATAWFHASLENLTRIQLNYRVSQAL